VAGAPQSQRARQKERTRARLLEAACGLFRDRGVAETRTADVARAAAVSHGTIFVHFPTRDDLVAAVIGEYAGRIARDVDALVERGATVRDVLRAHLDGLAAHEGFYARLVTEGPTLPSIGRSTLLGIQSVIAQHLAAAARPEIDAGRLRPVPIHLLFNTWLGLVHHYLVNRDLFAPGESVLAARGDELLAHYMGLLAPTGGDDARDLYRLRDADDEAGGSRAGRPDQGLLPALRGGGRPDEDVRGGTRRDDRLHGPVPGARANGRRGRGEGDDGPAAGLEGSVSGGAQAAHRERKAQVAAVLAGARGRRDERPNVELGQALARAEDAAGVAALVELLDDPSTSSDAVKALYECGYLAPELLVPHADALFGLLGHRKNRLVWGGMIGVWCVAKAAPDAVWARRDEVWAAFDAGTAITRDAAIHALATVAGSSPGRARELTARLLDALESCRPKNLCSWAERILPGLTPGGRSRCVTLLASRADEVTTRTSRRRLDRLLESYAGGGTVMTR